MNRMLDKAGWLAEAAARIEGIGKTLVVAAARMKGMGAALVVAAALMLGMTACTADENPVEEPTAETPITYLMTVEATMGGGDDAMSRALAEATRALSLSQDGKTLNATWTAGDQVEVYKYLDELTSIHYGTLTATDIRNGGLTCTLTGMLTKNPEVGSLLTLEYNCGSVIAQKGTLNYVAAHCDGAVAKVTVESVENNSGTYTIATTSAEFVNQQAIVRFVLKESNGMPLPVTQLNVKFGTKTFKVIPNEAMDTLYVAIPGGTKTVALDATLSDESHRYYTRNGVTFTNGKFYSIGVKMKIGTVDLSALTADYEAQDGDILFGTLPQDIKLTIKSGAEVTLNGVKTQESTSMDNAYAGIECLGNATINLAGPSTVKGARNYCPGIYVQEGKTLTIQGDGSMTAIGQTGAAGIGAGMNYYNFTTCGNITIKGGNVTAKGESGGAGIGSGLGSESTCGNIKISGGNVTATGSDNAAGIGSGSKGTCGNITISGGNVTATGGKSSAGIGGGYSGNCGNIKISGGSGTATMGKGGMYSIGAGINGTCGTVTIVGREGEYGVTYSPFTWSLQ